MTDRWYSVGREWRGTNPPINTWETVLGKDPQGREWRARAKYNENTNAWQVWFDHTEGETPFLRTEVVYADSYWTAMRKRHSLSNCQYKDIMKVIREFTFKNEILVD